MSELDELRRENAALRARLALDEQLESDAKRYEAIVATLDEGVVLHTRDGNIATCNAAAERILGLTVEQMMGRDSMDERWRAVREDGTPFPGDEHPAMVTLRTGEAQLRVVMGVHKPDGELTWIRITSQPLFAKDEAEPYAALATFTDITELKRAEQEQRRGAERLALALGAARLGTWEWSIADDVVSWSPEVETMFGVAPGGFGGTFEGYLALVHRDDQEALRARLEAAIEAPSSSSHFQVVHRIERDGRIAWIEGWGRVLRNERGEPVRMTGTVADITQRKSLEQQFLRAQRMETVGRLAGGVAHDFNNLLTAILGSVDLAEMAEIDDPTVDEALATIRMSSERAARLTTQLLAFARKGMVQLETLDLGTLVVDTYELMRRLLGAGVEISVVVPDSAVYVKADRGQVEQVLVNLAVNARDAMPSGGALRIAVRSDPGGSVAALEVSDDGAGMDEHVRERLFEPFFTTKEGRSGLGLASCYGIIQQLGGEIHVESKRGAGTTFRIQLPSARPSAIESLLEGEGQGTRLGGAERVLIVDDEPTIADVLERTMVAAGYEVTLCDNGVEALSLVEGGLRPDVVVTDVVMPHMGGTQLSERLTAIAPDLPIVFISGYTEDRAPSSGPRRSFLQKPFRPRDLMAAVRAAIDEA